MKYIMLIVLLLVPVNCVAGWHLIIDQEAVSSGGESAYIFDSEIYLTGTGSLQ